MNKLRKQSTEQGYYFGEFYFRWETENRRKKKIKRRFKTLQLRFEFNRNDLDLSKSVSKYFFFTLTMRPMKFYTKAIKLHLFFMLVGNSWLVNYLLDNFAQFSNPRVCFCLFFKVTKSTQMGDG